MIDIDKTFVTSDHHFREWTHFGGLLCESSKEQEEEHIALWNSVVGKDGVRGGARHGGAAAHDARFDLRVREVARVETDYPRRGEPADGGGRSIRNRKSMSGNVRKVALKALCICGE